MGKSIIVASAKGGVGKTTVISNLGVSLSKEGRRVALIDGSLTTPDLSLHLGIPFHVRGLANILQENAPLESAVFHHGSGMQVIPGNIHLNLLKEFEGKKFSKLIKKLKKEFDYVLVDGSAGLGREALSAMKHCDQMLVVVNPELTSLVNASKAIQIAKKAKVKPLGVVINRKGRFSQELKIDEITPLLHKVPIIGILPEDSKIPRSIRSSEVILDKYPRSRASREIKNISLAFQSKAEGKRIKLPEKISWLKSIFWGG